MDIFATKAQGTKTHKEKRFCVFVSLWQKFDVDLGLCTILTFLSRCFNIRLEKTK